jgi:hypothetical protein
LKAGYYFIAPGNYFIGSRVKTRCFQDVGQLDSSCTQAPHHDARDGVD